MPVFGSSLIVKWWPACAFKDDVEAFRIAEFDLVAEALCLFSLSGLSSKSEICSM